MNRQENLTIRTAQKADAPRLLEIYAQYIDQSTTFECVLPPEEEFAGRIESTLKTHPYLVALKDGRIIGYAYAHQLKEREAYQWSAELSMYFDRTMTHCGAGTQLHAALLGILQRQGIRTAYACVTSPNVPSENFLLKNGFQKIGTFPHAGCKNGVWHDTMWFARPIGSYDGPVLPVIPYSELAGAAHA